ncbi:dihydrolipoamide acetyltransferase family protein [Psychroflexus planctonicus]|uniref:Dihydrolipoamide acetyltransferase component of pyruvate dehydrogenase complex n=1 Tax=Psychroflexus planctonicus TaxID=1526575 RepID=A0ABQ1SG56_9FLAO|nr:dihydrolipoamide acetyltransferase family protein [Psychroflexus planctonicus]GGE37557.1 dihydrolipoamide acetyltransferase component of pyruvate dehydrogenase complex [Psychroflexus planctonicus]
MSNSDKTEISNKVDFKLPKMGESITEGTILNWIVNEGENFNEGDILVEVGTDKVDNEVPAPFSGKLIETKYDAQDIVKIGEVIAVLEEIDASEKQAKPTELKKEQSSSEPKTQTNPATTKSKSPKTKKVSPLRGDKRGDFYSPLVEKIAKEHHISYEELARIPASGANNRLQKSDIFKYIEDGRPAQFAQPVAETPAGFQVPDLQFDKGQGERIKMDRMRQMIADHMVFSKHTSPHVTAYVEADLTNLVNWRNQNKASFQEKTGEKLTFTPLFIQAVTKAIQDFPKINSSLDGDEIIVKDEIHIGMATALPSGNLIVPVVRNTDQKDLETLAKNVNALVAKARDNKLTSDETKGSTFTISNVGTFGSLMGTPIINQPEAAILATGIIKKRAEVMEYDDGDKIEIRQMMYLSLSFDHRIVDGFLAGSFLRRIADYLEEKQID